MSVTIQHHPSQWLSYLCVPDLQLDINESVKQRIGAIQTLTKDIAIKVLTSIQRESEIKSLFTDNITIMVISAAVITATLLVPEVMIVLDIAAVIMVVAFYVFVYSGVNVFMNDNNELSQGYQQQADLAESYIKQISVLPSGSNVIIA